MRPINCTPNKQPLDQSGYPGIRLGELGEQGKWGGEKNKWMRGGGGEVRRTGMDCKNDERGVGEWE